MQTKTERQLANEHSETYATIAFEAAVRVIREWHLRDELAQETIKVAREHGQDELAKQIEASLHNEELSSVFFSSGRALV